MHSNNFMENGRREEQPGEPNEDADACERRLLPEAIENQILKEAELTTVRPEVIERSLAEMRRILGK